MDTSTQTGKSVSSNFKTVLGKCRKLKKKVKNAMGKIIGKNSKHYKLPQSYQPNDNQERSENNYSLCTGTKPNLVLHAVTPEDQGKPKDTQNDISQSNQLAQSKYISCESRVAVLPPQSQKIQSLITSPEFKRLDDRAITMSRLAGSSLRNISEKLTRGCQTEISKVRVLFRWVVERDLRQRRNNQRTPRQCYHRIFHDLCSYAGLRCELIEGYSKGSGYLPGMRIQGPKFRNTWTAVVINSQWRFVNCTWAARHSSSCHGDYVDEFYFLTDPKDYIYQHFPNNPSWQLLQTPITVSEFIRLPVLKSAYFSRRLALKADQGAVIFSTKDIAELQIQVPDDVDIACCLIPKDKPDQTSYNTNVTVFWEEKEAVFVTKLSSSEDHYLSVYAGKIGDDLEIACTFVVTQELMQHSF